MEALLAPDAPLCSVTASQCSVGSMGSVFSVSVHFCRSTLWGTSLLVSLRRNEASPGSRVTLINDTWKLCRSTTEWLLPSFLDTITQTAFGCFTVIQVLILVSHIFSVTASQMQLGSQKKLVFILLSKKICKMLWSTKHNNGHDPYPHPSLWNREESSCSPPCFPSNSVVSCRCHAADLTPYWWALDISWDVREQLWTFALCLLVVLWVAFECGSLVHPSP